MTRRVRPTLVGNIVESTCGLAVDREHRVVKRRIRLRFASIAAARVVRAMLGRVPTASRQVYTSTESHGTVDDDDLLVQRGTRRTAIVVAEVDAPVGMPAEFVHRRRFASSREHQGIAPGEDVDPERAPALHQKVEKFPQRVGDVTLPEVQSRRTMKIPSDDHNRAARAQRSACERAEVGVGVDEQCSTAGARDPLAIVPGA